MKIFISWSGQQSNNIARQLGQWLPYIIQAIKPFVSSGNIHKGARWSDALAEELKETQYGIVCITRQNIRSPWLNFEAGALSKMIGQSSVSPLLFGVEPSFVQGPLSQFQATIFDEQGEDFRGLVSSINHSLPVQQQVSPDILRETFNKWWPDLRANIKGAASNQTDETDTGFKWLLSVPDLKSTEEKKGWEEIWVINPKPFNGDWSRLKPTMQKNIEQGVKYEFVVPSNERESFARFMRTEFDQANLALVCLGCIEQNHFKSLAVTHYRILNSKDSRKVLFEVPIESGGYWIDTEGEAVNGFWTRFHDMKVNAICKSISELPTPADQ